MADLAAVFQAAAHADGTVSVINLKALFAELGFIQTEEEVASLLGDLGKTDGAIMFEDFARSIALQMERNAPSGQAAHEGYYEEDENSDVVSMTGSDIL
eukprot:GILI01001184.1.p1 GENE.GILI01001184.1~~GILI01001184.1.p1  ORF type:complete len:109 (-),score=34.04 GILI01001184.1:66-362(-)